MAYEPFALKYRPRVFADVVGQEAVGTTLRNSLRDARIANAFLFAGSRGTGKTSMARILAKALNCKEAKDGEPCGCCETCESIARGDDIDVIEIDGASNRGIDEIRTIRDNAGYAPSRARFKVYIIDEVHMLTIQAFNALLKTLEEPPPHVRFIFATTEPVAVPETIHSRCQRHEFKRISIDDITGRLAWICREENASVPAEVLREIAVRSEGGLRDSTSLLDQVITLAGSSVTFADLDRVLGVIDSKVLEGVLLPLLESDTAGLLDGLDAAFDGGRSADEVLDQMVEILRAAMTRVARGDRGSGEGRRAALVAMAAERMGLDRILLALRLLLNARREMKHVGQGRLQLEIAFLKIARSRDLLPLQAILERLEQGGFQEAAPAPPRARSPAPVPAPARSATVTATPAPIPASPPAPPIPPRLEVLKIEWPRFLTLVREQKPRTAAMLDQSLPERLDASGVLTVRLPPGSDFQKRQLEGGQRKVVEDLLVLAFGHPFHAAFSCAPAPPPGANEPRPATQRVYEDPGIRKLLETFGGGVVNVEPAPPVDGATG